MSDWNPQLYNRFRRYRAEPFLEILRRLELGAEERIVDLGCGSGENAVELARRTARGRVLGIDASPAMIEAATALRGTLEPALRERLEFALGDIRELRASAEYSLVFSNAALQWVPDHRAIFASCLEALAPGGRLVAQMPANEGETTRLVLDRLVSEHPWSAMLGGLHEAFPAVGPADDYRRMLSAIGFVEVDCYYHTFEHPMQNPGEIVEFYRSTGLRPFLQALSPERQDAFLAAFAQRLGRAYGTDGALIFPFRRLFIWGRRAAPEYRR
jgi:trans-aconitate 2-methyltransferase